MAGGMRSSLSDVPCVRAHDRVPPAARESIGGSQQGSGASGGHRRNKPTLVWIEQQILSVVGLHTDNRRILTQLQGRIGYISRYRRHPDAGLSLSRWAIRIRPGIRGLGHFPRRGLCRTAQCAGVRGFGPVRQGHGLECDRGIARSASSRDGSGGRSMKIPSGLRRWGQGVWLPIQLPGWANQE